MVTITIRRALAALGAAALLAVSGAASATAQPRALRQAPHLVGFGATLAQFAQAHPLDRGACADTNCYGPLVSASPPAYAFSDLVIERGRVVGYTEALKRGTSLLEAELQVAELFPADAQASRVEVIKRDQFGASCGVYDIYSRQLKALFGPHAFGNDGGNVGVELATLTKAGFTAYNPRSVDLVIVMPTYADSGINC